MKNTYKFTSENDTLLANLEVDPVLTKGDGVIIEEKEYQVDYKIVHIFDETDTNHIEIEYILNRIADTTLENYGT